jgi:internalin A
VSYNQLETLPPEICRLRGLKSLNLHGNRLSCLPRELADLTELEALDLGDNGLTEMPPEVLQLRGLQQLYLGRRSLASIGRWRYLLSNLLSNFVPSLVPLVLPSIGLPLLDLQGFYRVVGRNELTQLPEGISALRELETLDLGSNHLENLPDAVGELRNLHVLRVDQNTLTELPSTLGQLHNLSVLEANGNRLERVALEGLTSLTSLKLDGNAVTKVPDVRRCAGLELLNLADNQVASIPDWIGELEQLRTLNLDGNLLARVPSDLGALRSLEALSLRNNSLTSLPAELGELSETTTLNLDGNPWAEPLSALVEADPIELFAYLRELRTAESLYEAKILLVGEGEVGKSSLRDALLGEPFVKDRDPTHGIELRRLRLRRPRRDVPMSLVLWDFGGQPSYRITDQFFFSRRAIYLVVWKPRQGVEENSVAGWFRRIRLRVGNEAKIFIVATHRKGPRGEIDYPGLRQKFGDIVVGHFEVDNEDGEGIDELREALRDSASQLPQMGELLPAAWRHARDEVLTRDEPQISYDTFSETCMRHGLGPVATSALAKLLHELGQVVHYAEDDGLKDVMILRPDWLAKAISYVLEDRVTEDAEGVLEHSRLSTIWGPRDGNEGYPSRYHPYFLRLMEKFDISYRIPDEEASLVAQLVPYERPDLPWDTPDEDARRRLILRCTLSESAEGLMAWFTVRNRRFAFGKPGKQWRHGVFLHHERYECEGLFEALDDRGEQYGLEVRGPSPDAFFHVLRESLEDLIGRRWEGLRYALSVPCRGHLDGGATCLNVFAFETLELFRGRERRTIECQKCLNEFDIAELLTGFPQSHVPVDLRLQELAASIRGVEKGVEKIEVDVADVKATTEETKSIAAKIESDLGYSVRVLLKAITAEVSECRVRRSARYRLTTTIPVGSPSKFHDDPGNLARRPIADRAERQDLPWMRSRLGHSPEGHLSLREGKFEPWYNSPDQKAGLDAALAEALQLPRTAAVAACMPKQ